MKYGFYPGCSFRSSAGYRESLEAVADTLKLDFVELRDWNCCGATVSLGQDPLQAPALTGRLFALARQDGHREVVTGCNACYTTLRKTGDMLTREPEMLTEVNRRLAPEGLSLEAPLPVRHLLNVFMDDVPEAAWIRNNDALPRLDVAAYYGCQYTRPWGDAGDPERPRVLEDFIRRLGFSAADHSAQTLCCGASHSVAYGKECRPLIDRIVRGVRQSDARVMATICPLCQFNLDQNQEHTRRNPGIPVLFFTQLAGLALGIDPGRLGLDRLLVPYKGPK